MASVFFLSLEFIIEFNFFFFAIYEFSGKNTEMRKKSIGKNKLIGKIIYINK